MQNSVEMESTISVNSLIFQILLSVHFKSFNWGELLDHMIVQYTKRVFTIFRVGFGVATLCLAQSQWFHGGVHREFQVIQRNSQRDEERGVIIDFWDMGCFIVTPCLYVSEREIPCL